jgi:hypothetical protein
MHAKLPAHNTVGRGVMNAASARMRFLTFAAVVALGVGSFALIAPEAFLASKGIAANPAAAVWMREVGVALVAIGFIAWCVRGHAASATLRAFLWGNALLQGLLLPVEILAYLQGTIPMLAGIVPNSILHVLLGLGFLICAWQCRHPPRLPSA